MGEKKDQSRTAADLPVSGAADSAREPHAAAPKRRRRPRRLRAALLVVAVILIVLVGAAPYVASTQAVSDLAISSVNKRLLGAIQLESLSLSWFGPVEISGLRVRDPEEREVLQVPKVSLARGVWHLITGPTAFEEISIDSPRVDLYVTADNQVTLAQAFQPRKPSAPKEKEPGPLPELRGRLVVRDGVIQVTRHDGPAYEVPELNLDADLQTLADVSGNLDVTLAGGKKLVGEIAMTDAVLGGRFDVSKAKGKIMLRTDDDVEIGPLAGVFAPDLGLVGAAHLDVEAVAEAGKLQANLSTGVKGLRSEQAAARVNPVDMELTGQVELTAQHVGAEVALSGDAGKANATISYAFSDRSTPVSVDRILNAVLTGESISLPDFAVRAQADVDLAALGRAVPGLLNIREGQEITGGTLQVATFSAKGGDKPAASGSIKLRDLAARGAQGTVQLEPISIGFDTELEAGKGLQVREAELTSSFARVAATGMASELRATFDGDLTMLQSELGKLFEFGSLGLAGKLRGAVELARAGDERVDVTVQVTGEGVRYVKDVRRFEIPQANISQKGHLALAEQKVSRFVASEARADLNGEVVLAGAGSYDLQTQAFQADIDIQRADVGFLSSRMAAPGAGELNRYGGSITGQASVGRASGREPIVSNGNLLAQGLTVDGQPLLENNVAAHWTDVQAKPDAGEIRVKSVTVKGGVANLSAAGVRYKAGENPTLDGQIQCSADLRRCMPAVGLIAKLDKPPAVAGQMSLSADCTTSARVLRLVGRGGVDQFEFGTGEQKSVGQRLQWEHDIQVDPSENAIRVAKAQLASQPLSVELSGTIGQYGTARVLALSGRYDLSWPQISALLHEFVPATAETVAISGESEGSLEITGPASQPDAQPSFRGVRSGMQLGWDSAEIYGVGMSAARFGPALHDGQLTLPVAAIRAADGTVNLGGTVDLRPAEPTLKVPGKLQVLDGVVITPELSRSVLSRINPIFLHLTRVEGTASLGTQDVVVPLGDSMKTGGSGKGRLDLDDMKVQPSGLLTELLKLGGLTDERMYTVQVSGLDLLLERGRIAYEDFTLTFPNEFDLKFYGSVGLDETLDLVVSLPLRAALLDRLGVRGPVAEYARALTGSRVDIPLVGTRLEPKLDLSRVDVKSLVERAIKESSGRAADDLLQGLLGGKRQESRRDKRRDR